MVHSVEQAVTLGAYAGTVVLPLARRYGDPRTGSIVAGLVAELWAGLPLVHGQSYVDREVGRRRHEDTDTSRGCADGGDTAQSPEDLVHDMLDLVRTAWRLARSGSAEELVVVTRFRLGEITAGLDHAFAVRHGLETPERPGGFEAAVRECFDLIAEQRAPGALRALGDEELHEHGLRVGEHLAECLEQGSACRLLTRAQVGALARQITELLVASGFTIHPDDGSDHPGVLVEIVDDYDLAFRHVSLHWHLGEPLKQRCVVAVRNGDYTAESLRRSGLVREVMGRSLLELVRAAGFDAHEDEDVGAHEVIVTNLSGPEALASFVGAGR